MNWRAGQSERVTAKQTSDQLEEGREERLWLCVGGMGGKSTQPHVKALAFH